MPPEPERPGPSSPTEWGQPKGARLLRALAGKTPARRSGSRQPRSRLAPLGERCVARSAAACAAPTTGIGRTGLLVPLISGPKRAGESLFQAFSPRVTRNWTFVSVQNRNVRTVRPPPYSTDSGGTREAAGSRLISANFGRLQTQ